MKRIKWFNILAIIASVGIIGWIITDYFGGMLLFMLSYSLLIIPIIIIYLLSFFETLYSLIKKGLKQNKIKVISHLIVILFIIVNYFANSDIFKSNRILTATLKDDLFHYTLIFRENGSCENKVNGIFGYTERFKGNYNLNGDTIVFITKPYNNDFLPDTVLIDREKEAIFINRNKEGNFITQKEWLNHFKIE